MAQSIGLPGKFSPVRYPSFPALERTALMSFNSTTGLSLPAGTTKALLMRQATYPFWMEQSYNGILAYGAAWIGQVRPSGTGGCITEPLFGVLSTSPPGRNADPNATQVGIINASSPLQITYPGSQPLLGIDKGCPGTEFIYVPAGASLIVVVSQDQPSDMGGTILIEAWDSPGQSTSLQTVQLVGAAAAYAIGGITTFSGNVWVRINSASVSFSNSIFTTCQFGMVVASGSPISYSPGNSSSPMGAVIVNGPATRTMLLPAAGPTEFVNSKLPWFSTRTTAAAVLLSNTTKVMNKEGNVLWGRVAPAVNNVWTVSQTFINTLHPAEKAFLPLESGTYSYCPPSTDMSNFWDYSTPSAFVPAVPVVRLDNDSLVNIAFFSDPDGGTSLAMNVDWHIEFRTSSTLFQIGLSTAPIEALHSAQLALVKSGFFFDNFDHVSIINRIISGLGSLYPLVKTMAPMLRGAAGSSKAASSIMSKQTSSVRATSARRSGITGSRHENTTTQNIAQALRQRGGGKKQRGPASVAGSSRSGASRSSRRSRRSAVTFRTRSSRRR